MWSQCLSNRIVGIHGRDPPTKVGHTTSRDTTQRTSPVAGTTKNLTVWEHSSTECDQTCTRDITVFASAPAKAQKELWDSSRTNGTAFFSQLCMFDNDEDFVGRRSTRYAPSSDWSDWQRRTVCREWRMRKKGFLEQWWFIDRGDGGRVMFALFCFGQDAFGFGVIFWVWSSV